MLKIKNISKKYGTKVVLDDINLEVNKGEVVALMGPSGVGKSTLLRILNNLEMADQGSVFLENKKLDLSQANKNHTIGMVFQNFNLFSNMTVERNITFVLEKSLNLNKDQAKKVASGLLAKYSLLEKANDAPSQLSGGQKQRLAIARTIALGPKVVCLDEPTSALDPLLTTYVAKIIQKLASEGYHILIATHDTHLVSELDSTIYLMEDGAIIQKASSKELSEDTEQQNKINKFLAGKIE